MNFSIEIIQYIEDICALHLLPMRYPVPIQELDCNILLQFQTRKDAFRISVQDWIELEYIPYLHRAF